MWDVFENVIEWKEKKRMTSWNGDDGMEQRENATFCKVKCEWCTMFTISISILTEIYWIS